MCRRNQLRGALILGLGLGILIGYMMDSWLLCCCGGIILLAAGFCILNRKS